MSLNRPVYASSVNGNSTPDLAVDGDSGSRWESAWQKDPQWLYVDLGASASISRVVVAWENARAAAFEIQVSDDEINWTPVYLGSATDTLTTDVALNTHGRYVRVYGTKRVMDAYGYSIYEFGVYGTGGVNPPPSAAPVNLALNSPVVASSIELNQPGAPVELTPNNYLAQNAVDGSSATRWSSIYDDKQWIYVDLGRSITIGNVVLQWQGAYGRAYDIQVSDDAQNWTTVYRQLAGSGGTESVPMYASGRYVRMQGIARGTSFGYSLLEFQVYAYQPGAAQPVYPIPAPSTAKAVPTGAGSYETGDLTQLEPPYPLFKTDKITSPIASNDWWQSLLIANLGNGNSVVSLPLKSRYSKLGLAITKLEGGYISTDSGSIDSDGPPDLYIMPNTINPAAMQTKVDGYGDYSVNVVMSDDATAKMSTTLVQGSPFVFNTFANPDKVQITSYQIVRFFDDSGATILPDDFGIYTGDHIGMEVLNTINSPVPQQTTRYYGLFAPAGSTFLRIGSTIKVTLGSNANYLSVGAMTAAADLPYFYQHAYAFVGGTKVDYKYDPATALVTTNFVTTTNLQRSGFSADTLMALFPHQWKLSDAAFNGMIYPSVRGIMKVHEGNTFTTVNRFHGILPQFAEPTNPAYSRAKVAAYLDQLDQSLANGVMNMDPYWQGKALHPLAEAILVADQLGDTGRRNGYLAQLRSILTDWFTYSPAEPAHSYYFHYNPAWGSVFAYNSGFGLNTGLTDHHFTYGYFTFAAAVLASYDNDFRVNYGPMVELLLRDYANPSRNDPQFPMFRNFNPYEGHSWAGGFADNRSGNNEEAAGEALFGWVGTYLWGMVNGNDTWRDAGIYGFTTEEKAIEQYWFNYDHDNWPANYTHGVVGQVYGSAYLYGTYFSGLPENIYGIHLVPTSEWETYYGLIPAQAGDLYNRLVADRNGPEVTWQHIIWPFQSLSDVNSVLAKYDGSVLQQNEAFNSYWFIHGMASLGSRSPDIWSGDLPTATIYKNASGYSAQVWNPTSATRTVTFQNASGVTGSSTVPPNTLAVVDPTKVTVAKQTVGGASPYLDRTGWTATSSASANGAAPLSNMFDGDLNTRWSSGAQQAPGQWVIVDMQAVNSFDTVFINAGGSGGDYPHGYEVYLSNDGQSWGSAVASGNDTTANIAVELKPSSARFIKVVITGSSPNWWSIAEFKVARFGTSGTSASTAPATGTANRAGWQASAFAYFNQDVPAHMLDGDYNTIWSSSVPQAPGQWIQFDLGSAQTFDSVTIDAGNRNGDYPRGYQIFVSNDGSNWGQPVASQSSSSQRQASTFAAQTARYIKVVLTGSASNWWSVAEFNIAYNALGAVSDIPKAGWSYSASSTGGNDVLAHMVDGDAGTRWTTGLEQSAGQWMQVDLGSVRAFKQIDLDAASDDYARGYQVYVSTDGASWGNPVATGAGSAPYLSIPLGSQNARYIKVVLTTSDPKWWSVAEMNVLN